MAALRIALLVTDGIAPAAVTPLRDRLEALGAQVTLLVPTGGPVLPIGGRYFAAAGGHAPCRALCQVAPDDLDVLVLPDGSATEQLARHPALFALLRAPHPPAIPVFTAEYLLTLLDQGVLARVAALAGSSVQP